MGHGVAVDDDAGAAGQGRFANTGSNRAFDGGGHFTQSVDRQFGVIRTHPDEAVTTYTSHYNQQETDLAFFDAQETPNVVDLNGEQYFFDAEEEETTINDIVDDCVLCHTNLDEVNKQGITKKPVDYEASHPFFAWLPANVVEKTFRLMTQYGCIPMSDVLKKWYKSLNPALNVHQWDEDVATDMVYSDTMAVDGRETSAQFFVGTKSLLCDVYGMKSDKQFVNMLEDHIHKWGAPM